MASSVELEAIVLNSENIQMDVIKDVKMNMSAPQSANM